MKRKSLLTIFILLMSVMLLAGCGSSKPAEIDPDDKPENIKEETAKEETVEEKTEEPVALTETECEDEVEMLLKTEPVTPDNIEVLSEMANCVTLSLPDGSGVIFSQMDNENKERLRMRFFDLIFYGGPEIREATSADLDPNEGVPLEECEKIFKDAYGENDLTPGEFEDVKDGRLYPTFGAGDAVHVIEHMQIFEDEDHYLLSGPMIRMSDTEGDLYEGYGDVLFSKNPAGRYGVTLLYGRYRDETVNISSVETSSTLPATKDKSYGAENLTDKDYTTVWAEAVPGDGIGETITIHLDKKQPVYGVQIISGYTASYKLYNDNGIPTEFMADFGNGAVTEGSLDEYYIGEQYTPEELADCSRCRVELDKPSITDTVTITITGVKPGTKYDDTCVSEVWVY